MRIALATCVGVPPQFDDDRILAAALDDRGTEVEVIAWDEQGADWQRFDLVVIRSTWDYTRRRQRFVAWAERVGDRLRNRPQVIRWNSDKRYLADLAAAGLPVIETRFVEPGERPPELEGEVVIKPTVSAGGRDTGRFAASAQAGGRELLERIAASGRTAMVQPYLGAVDREGEAAIVFIAGELAHTLRKRPVLRRDEVAPVRDDAIGAAEAMYDPDLVTRAPAADDEVDAAVSVIDHLRQRFGETPLIARVDLARDPETGPLVMEIEAIEPNLYLSQAPRSAEQLAEAVRREAVSPRP